MVHRGLVLISTSLDSLLLLVARFIVLRAIDQDHKSRLYYGKSKNTARSCKFRGCVLLRCIVEFSAHLAGSLRERSGALVLLLSIKKKRRVEGKP